MIINTKAQLTLMRMNMPMYWVLNPKSKAKYLELYISETDYAVLRTEYTLDEGEKFHNIVSSGN
jgi:hypothetical protein